MSKELEVAKEAAEKAAEILRKSFYKETGFTLKKDKSFLTELDKKAEESIISTIKETFPDHSIKAEESGFSDKESDCIWVIDPLDGTTNYITKFPFFAVSIALVKNGQLQVGVVSDAIHENIYFAEKGKGAYLNNSQILVSDKEKLTEAIVGYARPRAGKEEFVRILSTLELVSRTPKVLGSMALTLAIVGSAALDAAVLVKPNSWDAAAGSLIIQEAGGKVTDFGGNPWSLESSNILASNGKIHEEILQVLKS